jgi:hypothetical protein
MEVLLEQPGGDRAGGSGQGAAQCGGGQQEPLGACQAGVGGSASTLGQAWTRPSSCDELAVPLWPAIVLPAPVRDGDNAWCDE